MSEAFKCDLCEEFYVGDPYAELYEKVYIDRQGTDYPKAADVCSDCGTDLDLRGVDDEGTGEGEERGS